MLFLRKPLHQGSSYRSITKLSPVVKVLECLILLTLKEILQPADHQHGFRGGDSTTSVLCENTTAIADGLNRKRPHHRTIVVALDLTFDTVSNTKLQQDIYDWSLPIVYKRWMSERQSYIEFRASRSGFRKSCPQGSEISKFELEGEYQRNIEK